MELRPISDVYLDGKPLPSIQDPMSKKQTKNVDILSKLSSPDRLQAMLKSSRKIPPVKDQCILTAVDNAENNVDSNGQNTPLYGDPETQKVELLREGYFRAKSRADEYLLLVAAEKETLTSRGWVPGNGDSAATDLYSFKSKSAEKKQQYHQANRLYYGLSTLLYASIGAMKANELDVYVRRKALLLPGSIFDIKEWEQFLTLAKDCRSKEWRDGEKNAAAIVVHTKADEDNKAKLKSSLKGCLECLRSLRLDSEGMTDEVQDSTKEFGRYMIGAKKKIEEAMLRLGKTLIETKKSHEIALASLEVEKEKNRKHMTDIDEKVRLNILMQQDDSEDKMKLLKDEYEAELREKEVVIRAKEVEIREKEAELQEKESQRQCLSRENEDLAALSEKDSVRQQILETRLNLLETSHAENLLKLRRYEGASSEKGGLPAIKIAGMSADNKNSDVIPDGSKAARHPSDEEKENFKRVKERVAQLEGELEVAQKRQGSLPSTRASIIDVYGHDSAAVASEKEVLVRMEDVFEKKEMESWEENNKMRDQTLQKLRDEEEKEREEVERLFIELKRQEHEDALQKEREEAAKMEYELRMQEEENRIEKERMRDELARKTAVLELRKKEIEKEEQEIAEIHRLEQAVITKKNEKIEALRLAELHEVEEAARLVAKKKQEEEDIAARIKQEEEEDEQERLEDEKRIADWKILEAKRNEEEIIGEVVKAKELVRRQSMVISDEVEMMKPPEVVPKDPDSDDDNDNDVDKWTDFMSIEEWDGDSAPPVVVEGGPALDSLISGKVPCPAKVGRAKKRAAEKKTPGWANDLTVSDPPSRKDSAEAVELPALPCETVKSKNLVESKAQDETVPTADQEVVPPVTLKEYFSEVAVTEPVTVKETEVEALVPAAISQPMEVLTDKVEEEKEEKKTGDEKEKEEIEKENEEMEMQEEEDIKKEIVAPRVALDLVILVSDEEAVPTEERKPLESSVPAPVLPAVASKEIVQQDSEEVIQNPPSDLDIPPDAEPNVPHKYPSNDNDSKRENVRSEKLGDLQTEGLGTELSMMRSFMESLSPSKKTAKDRLERDMQRRRSEKEEEEGPSDAKESKKAERRPSKIGKEIKLTKSQKAAKILERQKRKEEDARVNQERDRVYREVGYRILAVQPDGPASRGKLEATVDIIVAVRGHRLRVLDSTLIEAIKGSEDQPLPLIVYNCDTREERDVELLPTRKWNGEGLLGATIRFEGYHEENDDAPQP